MSQQRQHILRSYFETLSLGSAGIWTRDLPFSRPTFTQWSLNTPGFKLATFGIITVLLNGRIVKGFVFHAIWVPLYPDYNTDPIAWHCVSFFPRAIQFHDTTYLKRFSFPKSPDLLRTSMHLCLVRVGKGLMVRRLLLSNKLWRGWRTWRQSGKKRFEIKESMQSSSQKKKHKREFWAQDVPEHC